MRLRLVAGLLGIGAVAAALCAAAAPAPAGALETAAALEPGAGPLLPIAPAAAPAVPEGPITFVGVAGLRWSDLDDDPPAALRDAVRDGARAAMTVRTTQPYTCPVDGWLTLNAGVRIAAERPDGRCAPLPQPRTVATDTTVPGWRTLAPRPGRNGEPNWGTLAAAAPVEDGTAAIRRSDDCATGPGAALAFADDDGTVLASFGRDQLERPTAQCRRLVVDAGTLPEGGGRRTALEAVDAAVAAAVRARPDATLIVAGIAHSARTPHLAALLIRPPQGSSFDGALLRSPSTRHSGLAQLVDLTTTVNGLPDDLPGGVLEVSQRRAEIGEVVALETAAGVLRDGFVVFFVAFIGGHLLALAAVALALRRSALSRAVAGRALAGVGLTFGAVPVAGFLANLLPWARWAHPAAIGWSLLAGIAIVLGALAAAGPWRRVPYGPAAAVAATTLAVMTLDVVVLGSRLQLGAPFGLSTLVAGRFYGFGNIAFAVFAVSALVLATAAWANLRGRAATAALVSVGAVALLVDGAPGAGTDFGGVLALAPGLAVLGLLLHGIRLTAARLALVALGTLALVSAIAVADWARAQRPRDRTHLGRFVQDVLDGRGLDVIGGKAGASFSLFANPLITAAAVPLAVAAVIAVVRPQAVGLHGLARIQRADPVFRALLVATLSTAVLGFAVNDSGVIVPAVALFTGAPLFVAVWAQRWSGQASFEQSPAGPERPAQGSAGPPPVRAGPAHRADPS